MRTVVALAIAVFAAATSARAADFDGATFEHVVFGQRAGQIYVYDYEPGVRVRAYWASPWRNRRYFPTTGTIPESGRDEDLNASRQHYKPAESFYREWRTSSDFDVIPYAQGRAPAESAPAPDDNDVPARKPPSESERFQQLPYDK